MRGIDERIFHVKDASGALVATPQPLKGAWESKFTYYPQFFAAEVPNARRLTCNQFIDQCPSSKRRLYVQAAEEWMKVGCTPKHAWLKPFVKFEKLDFESKEDPAPRVIQPRTPVYNYALGRYIRATASSMCQAIDKLFNGHPVVAKGMTPSEVGKVIFEKMTAHGDVVGVLLDAKRFDQHCSRPALEFEHRCWKAPFGRSRQLDWLLKQQLSNVASTFVEGHKLSYRTSGGRASGDMNTGEGNCIITCCMMHRFCVEQGFHWFDLINNGDDCVLFLRKGDLAKCLRNYKDWFLTLGFQMELEATSVCPLGVAELMEHIRFCQCSPVSTPVGWTMVREPINACAKDSMCLGESTSQGHSKWIHAVGMCGLSLYADIPIFCATYRAMVRSGTPSAISKGRLLSDTGLMRAGRKARFSDWASVGVADHTRVSFAIAFGIAPSLQLRIEEELSTTSCDAEIADFSKRRGWSPSSAVGSVVLS